MILYLFFYEEQRKEEGQKTVIPAVGSASLVWYEKVTPYISNGVTNINGQSGKGPVRLQTELH